MSTGHRIHLKGYRIDKKTGKPVKSVAHLDVSRRLQQTASKRVRINRGSK